MKEIQLGFFYVFMFDKRNRKGTYSRKKKRVGMIPTCIPISPLNARKVTMKLIHVVMNILAFMCC